MSNVENIKLTKLKLDHLNPRLSEFGITEKSSQKEILNVLWDEMAVNELLYSIVSNGFWEYEPLTIMGGSDPDSFLVIEGNRRLAAVMLLHDPSLLDTPLSKEILKKIDAAETIIKETKALPAIKVEDRGDAWRYIGFKHVNGPAKWGGYAKAKYIAEIHNNYKVPLDDIAFQIGDTNKTVQKLYQGLMILDQANKSGVYKYDDIQTNRIYFSHLYTGIQRTGIRDYLQIKEAETESLNPVPEKRQKELGQFLEWLYGSKTNDTQPIIKSQNPDLKYLDEVLQSKEATIALLSGETLDTAFEISRSSGAVFEEHLLAAKRNLQKTRAHLTTGYFGEESLLKIAGSVANLADDLYDEMDKVYLEQQNSMKKNRMTE